MTEKEIAAKLIEDLSPEGVVYALKRLRERQADELCEGKKAPARKTRRKDRRKRDAG